MKNLRVMTGMAFGALLGLLLGLSVSDVVGSFLTAAVAISAAILGVAPLPENSRLKPDLLQLIGFAIACVIATLVGLYLRTHNIVGMSTETQIDAVSKWKKTGISVDYATRIVTGVNPPPSGSAPTITSAAPERSESNKTQQIPGAADPRLKAIIGALSSGDPKSVCASLDPSGITGVANRIRTLEANNLSILAERIQRAPAAEQDALYESAWRLLCQ